MINISKDNTLADSFFSHRSLTIARAKTGPAEAPIAWANLQIIKDSIFCASAALALEKIYNVIPKIIIGLRPYLSDKGPYISCARAKPNRNALRVSWVFASFVPYTVSIVGRAGKYMSTDKGAKAVNKLRINKSPKFSLFDLFSDMFQKKLCKIILIS